MTLEISCETSGLRVKALIITADLETHSAIQGVDKTVVDNILFRIQKQLELLLSEAVPHRKQT